MNSLKKMILEKGTMTDFAKQAGIDLTRLSRICGGYLRPGRKAALKFASLLGIEVEEIFPEIFSRKGANE